MEYFSPSLYSFYKPSSIIYRLGLLGKFKSLKELHNYIINKRIFGLDLYREKSERIDRFHKENGVGTIDYFHPFYPRHLKTIYDPPIVIFYKGNLEILNLEYTAIVGTRKPSPLSIAACSLLGNFLSRNNHGIISGLAVGIDREAMLTSIQAKLPTIGVMASGFDRFYPPRNLDLYRKMFAYNNGIIITETPPFEKTGAWCFLKRNRIISGIARLVMIMEAPASSGALSTATHACEQGRDLAVFNEIELLYNDGGRKLISEGAIEINLSDLESARQSILHISDLMPENYENSTILHSHISNLERIGYLTYLGGGYYKKNLQHN